MKKWIKITALIITVISTLKLFNNAHAKGKNFNFEDNYSTQNVRLIKDLLK